MSISLALAEPAGLNNNGTTFKLRVNGPKDYNFLTLGIWKKGTCAPCGRSFADRI
jgi:hypothetical protein